MSDEDEEKSLLQRGQTVEEWWEQNGTDMHAARAQRSAAYAAQKLTQLPKVRAIRGDRS